MSNGSIIKRGADTYLLQVYAGSDWEGKPRRFTKTFHGTKAAAEKELAKFYAEVQDNKVSRSSRKTLLEVANEYREEIASKELRISSLRNVNTTIDIWITISFGKRKINSIKKIDVQKFVNGMSNGMHGRKGIKSKTVKNYFGILSQIMDYAVDMDYINDNPCKNVRLPKGGDREERECFSPDEVRTIVNSLSELAYNDLKYKVCVELALFGGFRKEEICGFNRSDVDFDNNIIRVRRCRLIGPGIGVYEDRTKTEKSRRNVALPFEIIRDIKLLCEQQDRQCKIAGSKYEESEALIRKDFGGPLYPQSLQRWFRRFCLKNEIRPLGLHSLRHTHASLVNEMDDIDTATLQKRMGHSNLTTTLNIYTHQFNDTDERIAKNISNEYFSNRKDKYDENE